MAYLAGVTASDLIVHGEAFLNRSDNVLREYLMHTRLTIQTLGSPVVWIASQPVHEQVSDKALALLVYLACTQQVHPRELLAEFLWEGRTQTQAFTNLRKVIGQLQSAVGPYLAVTRATLGIHPDADHWLDVRQFEHELAAAERALTNDHVPIRHLQTAVDLYRGDFLDGLFVESRAFHDWALLERERLHFRVTSALHLLIEHQMETGALDAAQQHIFHLLRLDPLRESAHRQAIRLYMQRGQRENAIRQYQTCQRLLEEELGIAPSAETTDLYQQIRDGDSVTPVIQPAKQARLRANLPVQSTAFIGREPQLDELLYQLQQPDCHLLTIVGPGGIGKTRLALEVARQALPAFPDGAFFAPLASVSTANEIVPAVLAALNLGAPEGEHDLTAYLLNQLAGRELLLVLDNMEHLVGDLQLLRQVRSVVPQVRLLVTSRQVLNLEWEWQFTLTGMEVPASATVEQPAAYGSVRLFVERARHVAPGFSFADDPAGVIRICERVEGMPLGIELAAAWLRVLPLDTIAESLFELESFQEAVEARHRSLRTLFENTWQRLSAREQRALMCLSVFQGGFRVEAAQAVAQLTLPQLAALVHKSLVKADYHTGRYDMHQLLVQFMRSKLCQQPDEEQQALERHAAFFSAFLQARTDLLKGETLARTQAEIQAEIDNIRAAWHWSVAHPRLDLIAQACDGLGDLYNLRSLHHEALAAFQSALAVVERSPESPERDRLELALLMHLQAAVVVIHGWTDDRVLPVCQRVDELTGRLGMDWEQIINLVILMNYYANERWNQARHILHRLGEIVQRMEEPAALAIHATMSEYVMWMSGDFPAAMQYLQRGLALFDPNAGLSQTRVFHIDVAGMLLSHLGYVRSIMGFPAQGAQALQAALDRGLELESVPLEAFALAFQAHFNDMIHQHGQQEKTLAQFEALITEHRLQHWLLELPSFHGSMLLQQGHFEAGIEEILAGLERQLAHKLYHIMPLRRAQVAYGYAMCGQFDKAQEQIELAYSIMNRTGERTHQARITGLHGELLRLSGDEDRAEAAFEQAITVAQVQQAKMFELQATTSLARLLLRQGRTGVVRRRLCAIVDWFPQDVSLPDLIEARSLLQQIASHAPQADS